MQWILILAVSLLAVPCLGQDISPPLRHGVNLSHWYAQWGDYEEKRLAAYNTPRDVQLIASMGFDHVRLTLDPTVPFTKTPGELNVDHLSRLRARIDGYVAAKLAVIVDLHAPGTYEETLKNPADADAFVKNWSALAATLADADPHWVVLEVLNEPGPNVGQPWRDLQGKVIQAMRAAAPRLAIIVSAGGWSSVDDFKGFEPYDMPNLIYTFHFYDPFLFTHQSAEWAHNAAQHVRGLNWPTAPDQADAVTAAVASSPDAIKDLHWNILQGDFTEKYITDRMNAVADWQKAHGNVRVYVGEFGAYRKAAPRDGLLRWHTAVRTAIESHDWGWAIWDYAGGFAVVKKVSDQRVPDEEILKTLGLRN